MIIKDFQHQFNSKLSGIYPNTEISSFLSILIEECLGLKRIDLVINPNFEIPSEKLVTLNSALLRLKQEEPIQYIIGSTEFYGFPFHVNKNVLIPRPETEELVEWVLSEATKLQNSNDIKSNHNITSSAVEKSLSILDIGTGSGCIPISLKKKLSSVNISAIDVSKKALEVAQKNAKLNEVDINFIQQDILTINNLETVFANVMKQPLSMKQITSSLTPRNDIKFDVIISNPPYVRELEKVEIKKNVLENEPNLALFVDDDDPLIFYRKIAELAKQHLHKNGLLFFEINQYLGKETIDLLDKIGFKNIELRKDLFGNDRMILARK